MRKTMLFLVNTHAGRGRVKAKLADIVDLFTAGGYDVLTRSSQSQGDVEQEISARGEAFDIVVVSGGDGTLHEAINGMMKLKRRPLLGYLPAGTVNDFATTLRIPKDPLKAAKTVLEGVPFRYDIGDFNGTCFSYVAAFGAVTDVAYETPQASKNVLGRVAYFVEGLRRLPTIENYYIQAEYDHGTVEGEFLLGLVMNAASVGGFKLHFDNEYKISLNDGLFEVILIRKVSNLLEGQHTLNAVLRQDLDDETFYSFKTSTLKLTCEQQAAWTLDGEYGGNPKDVLIRNHAQAIEIMVDQEVVLAEEENAISFDTATSFPYNGDV